MAATCAGFYTRQVAPWLVHGACKLNIIAQQRRRIVPQAHGVVVEVGIGSGLNLPHYDSTRVTRLIGVDPDEVLLKIGRRRLAASPFEVEILQESAERLPLESDSADTVLATYTFCTIADVDAALAEIRRVLKPGGRLLFSEHGRSHHPMTARWQDRLTPLWSRLAGGCRLNRNVSRLIANAGFRLESVDNFTLPFTPGVLGFQYLGSARPR